MCFFELECFPTLAGDKSVEALSIFWHREEVHTANTIIPKHFLPPKRPKQSPCFKGEMDSKEMGKTKARAPLVEKLEKD